MYLSVPSKTEIFFIAEQSVCVSNLFPFSLTDIETVFVFCFRSVDVQYISICVVTGCLALAPIVILSLLSNPFLFYIKFMFLIKKVLIKELFLTAW